MALSSSAIGLEDCLLLFQRTALPLFTHTISSIYPTILKRVSDCSVESSIVDVSRQSLEANLRRP